MKPPRLHKGDTIGIVAPASSFDRENFKKGAQMLRQLGYKVKYETSIFNECWSKPGHNKQRGLQINRMFADKEVKAILCAKAGTGSREIISYLDEKVIRANPKIFVGYSDITILLLYLQRVSRAVVFHGPVLSGEFFEGMNQETIDSFVRLLGDSEPFGRIQASEIRSLSKGKAEGVLVGGNLSLVLQSIGTEYEIQTKDKFFFLEDIDEPTPQVLEDLQYLKELGKLNSVRGVVFGRFTNCFADEEEFVRCMKDFFKDVDYPILYRVPAGHIEDTSDVHFLLPLGVKVTVDADRPALEISESAVR